MLGEYDMVTQILHSHHCLSHVPVREVGVAGLAGVLVMPVNQHAC